MRTLILLLVVVMCVALMNVIVSIPGICADSESADKTLSMLKAEVFESPGLPKDFNYAGGYSEYEVGENEYVAYIAIPDDETVDIRRAIKAVKEGWVWENSPYADGACLCTSEGGSPELRVNDVRSEEQSIFFEYKVVPKASEYTIDSATLYMHCCWTNAKQALDVSCWECVMSGTPGKGENYLIGNYDKFVPYCDPTPSLPSFLIGAVQDVTTVYGEKEWYSWDVTALASKWAAIAPTTGWVILSGEGSGKFKRFSSACNTYSPELRPYVQVFFHK
jgi:hypothetical protein